MQATDGAGPAIIYAETVDDSPADGRIDGVKVGFSEPVSTLKGNPFKVASGVRIIVDDPEVTTDGPAQITGGVPSDPLYGGVAIPLHPLTTDGTITGPPADPDGADSPTLDYATITAGATKTDYAADAAGNDVVATGATAFTGTLDRVRPLLRTMQTLDVNADGFIDRLNSTWTEPIVTDGTPSFAAFNPQNAPLSGYTPPTVAAGATAAGHLLSVNLNAASLPDRDIIFESQYVASGPTDASVADAAGNNAPTTPVLPSTTAALCARRGRSLFGRSGRPAVAGRRDAACGRRRRCAGHALRRRRRLLQLHRGSGELVTVLLSIAPQALVQRAGNSYNPFVAAGPGGAQSVSVTFDDAQRLDRQLHRAQCRHLHARRLRQRLAVARLRLLHLAHRRRLAAELFAEPGRLRRHRNAQRGRPVRTERRSVRRIEERHRPHAYDRRRYKLTVAGSSARSTRTPAPTSTSIPARSSTSPT